VDVADLGTLGLYWGQIYPGMSGSAGSFAEALQAVGLDGAAIPEPRVCRCWLWAACA